MALRVRGARRPRRGAERGAGRAASSTSRGGSGRGAPLPRRGKLIAIQYYETAAASWRPVLFVRSDRGGRFRARYRFRYLIGRARIRFRAVALAEERWPYATGVSAPVTVRVGG